MTPQELASVFCPGCLISKASCGGKKCLERRLRHMKAIAKARAEAERLRDMCLDFHL